MLSPTISVVVLTHNTRDLVLQCVAGFYDRALALGWQLIVVDNGSNDDTAHAVAEMFPAVELIRSERNLGFAAGSNLGLRRAVGRVVVLMNSDIIASAETLQALADELLAHPEIGALSPRLLTADGTPQPFAFGSDPKLGYLLRRGLRAVLRRGPMHNWSVDHPIEVDWVSGACLCIRQEVLQQIGLLDERFFLYFEDNDWCLRARQAGWRIVYDPRWQVTHLGGASQPMRQLTSQTYYRSLTVFYAKHYGPTAALLLRLLLPIYSRLMAARRAAYSWDLLGL